MTAIDNTPSISTGYPTQNSNLTDGTLKLGQEGYTAQDVFEKDIDIQTEPTISTPLIEAWRLKNIGIDWFRNMLQVGDVLIHKSLTREPVIEAIDFKEGKRLWGPFEVARYDGLGVKANEQVTAFQNSQGLLEIRDTTSGKLLSKFAAPERITAIEINKSHVIYRTAHTITAIDLTEAEPTIDWQVSQSTSAQSSITAGDMIISDASIFYSGDEGQIVALNASTGEEIWSQKVPGDDSPFLYLSSENEIISVSDYSDRVGHVGVRLPGEVTVFDVKSGQKNQIDKAMFHSVGAVNNRILIAGFNGHRLKAYDSASKKLLWEFVGTDSSSHTTNGDVVLFKNRNQETVCIDINTGKTLWQRDYAPDDYAFSKLADGKLLVYGENLVPDLPGPGCLVIDPRTGSEITRASLPERGTVLHFDGSRILFSEPYDTPEGPKASLVGLDIV